MKKLPVILLLCCPVILTAQYTAAENKKMKISKLTRSVSSSTGDSSTWVAYYDRNGNDTAVYVNGALSYRVEYTFDKLGKPLKAIHNDPSGIESVTIVYTYFPDASYKIASTDKSYGLTNYEFYDKSGKLVKTQTPDGAVRIYTYDAGGHLLTIKNKPGSTGINVDLKYSYNAKGQRMTEESNGEWKWKTSYTYDTQGQMLRSTTISTEDGSETKTEARYEYIFWK